MDKKKFLGLLAVLMIAAVAAWNVNLNSQKDVLSDLSMENVEALADESGGGKPDCSTSCSGEWCGGVYIDGTYFYLHDCALDY